MGGGGGVGGGAGAVTPIKILEGQTYTFAHPPPPKSIRCNATIGFKVLFQSTIKTLNVTPDNGVFMNIFSWFRFHCIIKGYLTGAEDYYKHVHYAGGWAGKDLREDEVEVADQYKGEYSTLVFTKKAEDVIRNHDPSKVCMAVFHMNTTLIANWQIGGGGGGLPPPSGKYRLTLLYLMFWGYL